MRRSALVLALATVMVMVVAFACGGETAGGGEAPDAGAPDAGCREGEPCDGLGFAVGERCADGTILLPEYVCRAGECVYAGENPCAASACETMSCGDVCSNPGDYTVWYCTEFLRCAAITEGMARCGP